MGHRIGIDFGTTKTLVAECVGENSMPQTRRLGRDRDSIPTTLHVDRAGHFLFGDEADDCLAHDPGGYIRSIKRDLGSQRAHVYHGHRFTAKELICKFLTNLRIRIENECLHGKIDHAVITVPAKFSPAQKVDLQEAAKAAGFPSVELLDEPVAAGLAFLQEKLDHHLGNEVLVFDWGGGTLDIAFIEKRHGQYQVNDDLLGGEAMLGGEDIDEALVDSINQFLIKDNQLPVERDDAEYFPSLKRTLIQGKELLSKREDHTFRIKTLKHSTEFPCSRAVFESVIRDPISRAISALEETLQKAERGGFTVKSVLLIGGSSRIPAIARAIKERFNKEPIVWSRSLDAVALGAALKSAMYKGKGSYNYIPVRPTGAYGYEVPRTGTAASKEVEKPSTKDGESSTKADRIKTAEAQNTAKPLVAPPPIQLPESEPSPKIGNAQPKPTEELQPGSSTGLGFTASICVLLGVLVVVIIARLIVQSWESSPVSHTVNQPNSNTAQQETAASVMPMIAPSPLPLSTPLENASTTVSQKETELSSPLAATRLQPFANSIGMQFVPVLLDNNETMLFSVLPTSNAHYAEFTWAKKGTKGSISNSESIRVSWMNANAFCDWLTEVEKENGKDKGRLKFRLPTNAEWSKAAKGDYGLLEMTGGAWQWCSDLTSSNHRVVRGGNRANGDTHGDDVPSMRYGFRVVLEVLAQ